MDTRMKIPMIAGIILQGLAVVIAFGCYLLQSSLGLMPKVQLRERVFPGTLVSITLILLLHIITLLVMQTYEGESRRLIGGVLAATYCAVNIAAPIISRIEAIFDARRGVEFLAAKNVLASVISMFSSPLSCVSLVLVMLALGRYGVLDKETV